MDRAYEKKKAKEMLELVEKYNESSDKKTYAEKLNKISDEVYYKKRTMVSQKMVDIALAIHSFTKAALAGGPYQDFEEFVPDLGEILEG